MSRAVHHLALWVADLITAEGEWGWLLGELGWETDISWESGRSWGHPDGTHLFVESPPDQHDDPHDRLRPGMNHLALLTDERPLLDRMRAESSAHGWHEVYADRYPHAGGDEHVALYLENSEGFEIEVVWQAEETA